MSSTSGGRPGRTAPRTLIGLLVALITAVVVWWTQGDGGTPTSEPTPSPTAGQTTTAEPTSGTTADSASPSAVPPASDPTAGESTGGEPPSSTTGTTDPTVSAPSPSGGTDPESGLPIVRVDDLPPEAAHTLELIDQGGPFPYDRDGVTFENREDILPAKESGYYREYTVETPGSQDRGARRIVAGDGGEFYWTQDHYSSFSRIAR